MKKRDKYLWMKKTDSSLLLWPKASVERSLIKPTAPERFVSHNPKEKVTAPYPLPFGGLEAYGISHAAISAHAAAFYTSRSREKFNYISYTLSGSVILKIDKKEIQLKEGSLFYASSKSEYTLKIAKVWRIIFFHLEKSKRWNNLTNAVYIVRKSKFLNEIKYLAEQYFKEVYKPDRSLRLLCMYAEQIAYFIRRELSDDNTLWQKVDEVLAGVESGSIKDFSVKKVARDLNISVYELNKFCTKTYGMNLATLSNSIRMDAAKRELISGYIRISEVAKSTGYANVHAFSKAFKKSTGMSPSEFAELAKAKISQDPGNNAAAS